MWIKLDDRFAGHPKVKRAGPEAAWMYVCGLLYCASYLTDGLIPNEEVATLADVRDPKACAGKLVEVGLWEIHDNRDYYVHDYLDYNPSKEEEDIRKAADRRRKRPNGFRLDSNGIPSGFRRIADGTGRDGTVTGQDWTGLDEKQSSKDKSL